MKRIIMFFTCIMLLVTYACETPKNNVPDDDLDKPDIQVVVFLHPGIDTIQVGESHHDAGAYVMIDDIELTVHIIENDVNPDVVGIYNVVYEVTYEDQTYRFARIVHVVNTLAPMIRLNPGVDTVIIGTSWEDAGVTVLGNDDVTYTYTVEGTVDIYTIGVYEIVYSTIDEHGNQITVSRFVHVIE